MEEKLKIKGYKAVDYVQWVYKHTFGIEKSKSQIRRDIEQGSVKLNDKKITLDTVFIFEDVVDKTEICD